ncbi:MAG: NAD(P)H-dependent glycerol-3-phosphate dehydrogenase [Actinomycetota bacterium]
MIAIVGAGSMGAALASHLKRTGREVALLATEFDTSAASAIRSNAPHPGLGRVLPGEIDVHDPKDWPACLGSARIVVLAVSSAGIAPVVNEVSSHARPDALWAVATKGFDEESLRSAATVAAEALGDRDRVVALVGPSLAAEIAAGVPTGLVAACANPAFAGEVARAFESSHFRVDVSTDVDGVEVGAALKNVIAIAAGFCDGLAALEPNGSWTNTKAFVFSRGLQEMALLSDAMGGDLRTVLGLSSAGDLFVTCLGGRNGRFGRLVGEGLSPKDALERMHTTVEGYSNARSALALARKFGIDLPIARAVFDVLYEGMSCRDAIAAIFEHR